MGAIQVQEGTPVLLVIQAQKGNKDLKVIRVKKDLKAIKGKKVKKVIKVKKVKKVIKVKKVTRVKKVNVVPPEDKVQKVIVVVMVLGYSINLGKKIHITKKVTMYFRNQAKKAAPTIPCISL